MPATSPRALGAAVAALGLLACGAALTIGSGEGAWAERTVPLMAGAAIAVSGVAIAGEPSPANVDPGPDGRPGRTLALLGLGALWLAALGWFGFLIPTMLAAPAAFAFFGQTRSLSLLAAAILVPLALHLFFFRVLGVFPPYGRLFDLADHLPI
ncbi:MAG: tripartite tricarboxylate transporter TctB family protein [Pseudomonadota bacterium]